MQRKFSKLLVVLAVCLMAFSCLTYAASPNTPAPASHSSDTVAVIPLPTNADLYDNPDISSKAFFTSTKFEAPYSTDIRVWFDNQGSETATVTLTKEGWLGDHEVGSFDVSAGTNAYKEFSADKNASYRIGIKSANGSTVKGYLRGKQDGN